MSLSAAETVAPAAASLATWEPLAPDAPGVDVIIFTSPFRRSERVIGRVPAGWSLQDIVDRAPIRSSLRHFLRIWVGDVEVVSSAWRLVRPKAGVLVSMTVEPQGGGGGGGKNPLRTILTLVVMVVAIVVAWYAAAAWGPALAGFLGTSVTAGTGIVAGVVGGTLMMMGNLALNALIPPTTPKLDLGDYSGSGGVSGSTATSITGSQNRTNLYGAVPIVFGRRRVFPPLGAHTYSEYSGNYRYFRMLFVVGYGPIDIQDICIGDTPISIFEEAEVEIRNGYASDPPLTLYTNNIREESFSILLDPGSSSQTTTVNAPLSTSSWYEITISESNEVALSFLLTDGLGTEESQETLSMSIEVAPATGGTWSPASILSTSTNSTSSGDVLSITAGTSSPVNFSAKLSPAASVRRIRMKLVLGPKPCQLASYVATNHSWQQRSTKPECDEISFDLACPRGLTLYNTSGGRSEVTIQVEVQYSPKGLAEWVHPTWADTDRDYLDADGIVTITDNSTSQVLRSGRWKVSSGQYDVRWRRVTEDSQNDRQIDTTYVSALRSIKCADPVKFPYPVAKIALRIREGGQISGVVQQLNCIATAILQDWDAETGTYIERKTRNPAAAFRRVLCGPVNEKRVDPAERLHLASLQDWSEACAALMDDGEPRWTFDAVVENFTTAFELLKLITSHGRARLSMPDGKYGVVRDIAQTTPVQNFSPRNTWGYQGSKGFPDLPHALKVGFTNQTWWEDDEIIVYADGYSEEGGNGTVAASLFETTQYVGCTNEKMAWREGRYHLAVGRLRPDTHTLYSEVENIRCTQGDLVMLSHDAAMIGLAAARVKSLKLNEEETRVTGVVIDEIVAMTTAKTYSARFRLRGGENMVVAVEPINGETRELNFLTPLPLAQAPFEKTLVQFGETGLEAAPMLVTSIQRSAGYTAKITMIDAAPEVHQADTGPIPDYNPRITKSSQLEKAAPAIPRVLSIRSDESVLVQMSNGSFISRIVVGFATDDAGGVVGEEIEGQIRALGGVDWGAPIIVPTSTHELNFQPVEDRVTYEMRFRQRKGAIASDWGPIITHTAIGKSSKPPSPTSLLVERLPDDTIRYRWADTPPKDHSGYRMKWNSGIDDGWDRGIFAQSALISATWFETKAFAGRAFTVMVKSVDTSGNESEDAATAIVNLGDAVPMHVMDTIDVGALGWEGTIVGGSVVGGSIVATIAGVLFTDPAQPLFTDPSQDLLDTYSALSFEATFRVPHRGFMRISLDADGSSLLEYCTIGLNPLFTNPAQPLFTDASQTLVKISDYVQYLGPMDVPEGVEFGLRVTIPGGGTRPVIRSLVVDIELPVSTETQNDVAISAGGSRVTPTKDWHTILNVRLDLQEEAGYPASRVVIADKNPTLGPLIKGYDSSNSAAAALVDVTIQGILNQ